MHFPNGEGLSYIYSSLSPAERGAVVRGEMDWKIR